MLVFLDWSDSQGADCHRTLCVKGRHVEQVQQNFDDNEHLINTSRKKVKLHGIFMGIWPGDESPIWLINVSFTRRV